MRKNLTEVLRAAALVTVAAFGLTGGAIMAAEGAAAPKDSAPAAAPLVAPAGVDDDWHAVSHTGIWLMGMDGTVGGRNNSFDVDLSFSDVSDYLDYSIMPDYELYKGDWAFLVSGMISKMSNDDTINGRDVTEKIMMYVADFGIGYTIVRTKVEEMPLTITPVVGFRYTGLSSSLKVGHEPSNTGWRDWVDIYGGAIAALKINNDFDWTNSASIGTGALWGGSDLVYTAQTMVDWNFSKKWSLSAGYRIVYWDYDQSGFTWDMTFSGPYIGVSSKWF